MKKPKLVVVVAALLALGIGSLSYAGVVVADVHFPFKAAGVDLPAGKYRIETIMQDQNLEIRNLASGKAEILPLITRISPKNPAEAALVFDKAGDQYSLSEIYIPGIDGFLLQGATENHTHVKINAGK